MSVYYVGSQQQFYHHEFDSGGGALGAQPGIWSSSNESVATIDQSGLASWLALGETDILYLVGAAKRAGVLHVVVHNAIPATLTIIPSVVTTYPQSVVRVVVTAHDSGGNPIPDLELDSVVSSDPTVATVILLDKLGTNPPEFLVAGLGVGGTTVVVFASPLSAALTVNVNAALGGISQGAADARYRQLGVIIADSEVSKTPPVVMADQSGAVPIVWTYASRARRFKQVGDVAITVSAIPVGEYQFIDIETGVGGFGVSFAVSGLPTLEPDTGAMPVQPTGANLQFSYMLFNEGPRTIISATWYAIPTS